MPKFKEPSTLESLAMRTLETLIWRASPKATVNHSGSEIVVDITGLHDYFYASLPHGLCNKLTAHMLSNVVESFRNYYEDKGSTNVNNIIILGIIRKHISLLDLSDLPLHAQRTFTSTMPTFEQLRTLILSTPLDTDVVETLPLVFGELKFLVNFLMRFECSDAIIKALQRCSRTIEHIEVDGSEEVTNASFEILKKCPKLKHVLICDTSTTAEGFDRFLQCKKSDDTAKGLLLRLLRYKKSEDTAKCLLRLSVGSPMTWAVSSRQLNEIASACPMLTLLEISGLCGDMENLVSLTALKVLKVRGFDFEECNLDGFLRSRGSDLLSLELMYANSKVDLMCIMEHCPNIKELTVFDCGIMDMKWANVENVAEAFENLEVLDLSYECSTSSIERMLHACVNLKCLRLNSNREAINDEFILRLLFMNPLQKLTTFCVYSGDLSMTSVNALIQQCPLLEELEDLDEWSGVTDTEIITLIRKTKAKNLDLRLD